MISCPKKWCQTVGKDCPSWNVGTLDANLSVHHEATAGLCWGQQWDINQNIFSTTCLCLHYNFKNLKLFSFLLSKVKSVFYDCSMPCRQKPTVHNQWSKWMCSIFCVYNSGQMSCSVQLVAMLYYNSNSSKLSEWESKNAKFRHYLSANGQKYFWNICYFWSRLVSC